VQKIGSRETKREVRIEDIAGRVTKWRDNGGETGSTVGRHRGGGRGRETEGNARTGGESEEERPAGKQRGRNKGATSAETQRQRHDKRYRKRGGGEEGRVAVHTTSG
jgi:hypothetical protein